MTFDDAFKKLIGNEGTYTNDTRDPGNWTGGECGKGELKGTKFGISAASYPTLDINSLTLAQAKDIYHRDFWLPFGFNQNIIPECLRFDLFDTAVNSGVATAIKLLQKTVGVEDDGVIGPATKSAISALNNEQLDSWFSAIRLLYICSLKNFPTYGKGWVVRIANNMLGD